MTIEMLDSLEQPSFEQAELFKADGYRIWGLYVLEWAEGSIDTVRKAGFEVVPIVAPANLDGDGAALADEGMARCRDVGLEGALGLDTEKFESSDPRSRPFIDAFNGEVHGASWLPDVYSGAGYVGRAADWVPAWTANAGIIGPAPSPPGASSARQWAGNIRLHGVLVDLNVAGDNFPRSNMSSARPPNVAMPTLSAGHRGTAVCSLQGALNAHVVAKTTSGPPVRIDGIFGGDTLELLLRFQASRAIGPWRWAGPETYEHLFPPLPTPAKEPA